MNLIVRVCRNLFKAFKTLEHSTSCYFFQAEDGIRDWSATGVQTCALPIRSEEHTSELQSLTNLGCRLIRSEEHTSELQSLTNLVFRLLLDKMHACVDI